MGGHKQLLYEATALGAMRIGPPQLNGNCNENRGKTFFVWFPPLFGRETLRKSSEYFFGFGEFMFLQLKGPWECKSECAYCALEVF